MVVLVVGDIREGAGLRRNGREKEREEKELHRMK